MDAHVVTNFVQACAAAVASARLINLKLGKQFPVLLTFLVFLAGINLGLGLMNDGSVLYFWSYLAVEPLKCVLSIAAVSELFSLTFEHYPGIRSVSRWVMCIGIALSLAISLLITDFFWEGALAGRSHSHVFYFETAVRAVVFTLAAVILANLFVLSKYPLHLSRNNLVCSAFFSAMFLGEACCLLFDSLAPQLYNRYIDTAQGFFICACLAGWTWMLRAEAAPQASSVHYSTLQEDHLLDQLTLLNQMMTRSVRR
jgi:hypothetical protein